VSIFTPSAASDDPIANMGQIMLTVAGLQATLSGVAANVTTADAQLKPVLTAQVAALQAQVMLAGTELEALAAAVAAIT
jgi:hypothetical protein